MSAFGYQPTYIPLYQTQSGNPQDMGPMGSPGNMFADRYGAQKSTGPAMAGSLGSKTAPVQDSQSFDFSKGPQGLMTDFTGQTLQQGYSDPKTGVWNSGDNGMGALQPGILSYSQAQQYRNNPWEQEQTRYIPKQISFDQFAQQAPTYGGSTPWSQFADQFSKWQNNYNIYKNNYLPGALDRIKGLPGSSGNGAGLAAQYQNDFNNQGTQANDYYRQAYAFYSNRSNPTTAPSPGGR